MRSLLVLTALLGTTTETNHIYLLDATDLKPAEGISQEILSGSGAHDMTQNRPSPELLRKRIPVIAVCIANAPGRPTGGLKNRAPVGRPRTLAMQALIRQSRPATSSHVLNQRIRSMATWRPYGPRREMGNGFSTTWARSLRLLGSSLPGTRETNVASSSKVLFPTTPTSGRSCSTAQAAERTQVLNVARRPHFGLATFALPATAIRPIPGTEW